MKHNYNGPVVAIDIDGTLGDYHGHFLHFAEAWYGRPMPSAKDINPGLPLHKFMRTSKATYRQCKLAYRQGGLKRSMPAYPGASELCARVRQAGAELWICTTRPYLRLDNIDPDTRHWLRRNHIQFDAVIYGENKYCDLARNVGRERVAAVMDDLPEMYLQAITSLGYQWPHRMRDGWPPVLLRDQPYNRHMKTPSRIHDMPTAEREILWLIDKWRKNNDHS
jgi:hypothetical protein